MSIALIRLLAIALACAALANADAQPPAPRLSVGGRSLLHAHNCYPEDGRWQDRIDRALTAGGAPLAIEQDIAWTPPAGGRPGRSVVSHDGELTGTEPTLEEHFFARIRPMMQSALQQNRRDQWPVLVLHLDFKTNEREHHQAVWDILSRHRDWLTTAERVADPKAVMPFQAGPLLVLTENGPGQEAAFSDSVLVGERLLLFGTTPNPTLPALDSPNERAAQLATTPAAALVPWPASNYRRWTNFSWHVIERGGQAQAGDWTPHEAGRLQAIVQRAHAQGLWVRFYTLNGHGANANRGWSAGYNFGTTAAVRLRWQAAIDAGVDFIATDQYEEFAKLLTARGRER